MTSNNNKWKDYLLKSGIPLEYEVKSLLEKYSLSTNYEQTYLRKDKTNIETEFSYDLDCIYIKELSYFNLMIECKYRYETTNWLFLPEEDNRRNSMTYSSILHPNDFFTESNKFHFKFFEMPYLAPVCSKGIEITNDGQNPKTIDQAINQLSYGMSRNILDGMYTHLESDDGLENEIFFQIPIIVTTANLYRLKQDLTISDIKNSSDLDMIAKKHDSLIIKSNIGKDLENYNRTVLSEIFNRFDKQFLNKRLSSINNNIEDLIAVLSKHFCPQSILIIHHSSTSNGFENLIKLMDEIALPTPKTIKFVKDKILKQKLKESYNFMNALGN